MRKHGGWGPFGRIPSICFMSFKDYQIFDESDGIATVGLYDSLKHIIVLFPFDIFQAMEFAKLFSAND